MLSPGRSFGLIHTKLDFSIVSILSLSLGRVVVLACLRVHWCVLECVGAPRGASGCVVNVVIVLACLRNAKLKERVGEEERGEKRGQEGRRKEKEISFSPPQVPLGFGF